MSAPYLVNHDPNCKACDGGFERECMSGEYVRCSSAECREYVPPSEPLPVPTWEDCKPCGGVGYVDGHERCRECGGTGEVERATFDNEEAEADLPPPVDPLADFLGKQWRGV